MKTTHSPRYPPDMTKLIALLGFAAAAVTAFAQPAPSGELRLNHLQVIGSHNSFKAAVQPELLAIMKLARPDSDDVDYAHLPLRDQLNLGLRNLELDVYNDPDGGRYARPLGNVLLAAQNIQAWDRAGEDELARPGFKIIHQVDFDFRSTVYAFEEALDELAAWSRSHRSHECIILTMNLKQDAIDLPGAAKPAPFEGAALESLNALIRERMGECLLTPDQVRGGSPTLREAIVTRGWPTVDQTRGRFLFVLDEGGKTLDLYLERFRNLKEAAYFVSVDESHPCAGVFVINDPISSGEKIRTLVKQNFIVRTRADAGTREARRVDFTRFEAAKASGAQVITTDYYVPDRKISDRYMVRFDGGGFVRANPVTSPQ